MLALLPAAAFLLTVLALRLRIKSESWREAFLAASALFGTLTALATEALSLFHLITFPAIVCFWTAATLVSAAFLYSRKTSLAVLKFTREDLTGFSRVMLGCIGLYVLAIALIAFVSPPNTGDTFEYHMPKVLQWVQNHTIGFFPTAVPRQNHLAPGAEFAILHLQVLSGSDRFASFIEWMSMLGSLVAISLIARHFGAAARGQLLSVIFALTLPMGIMQASSTQTDYVIAFWLICFVYYLLRFRNAGAPHKWLLLGMAASLGLAVFSKGTAYLLAPPFLLWLAVHELKMHGPRALKSFAVFAAIFLCVNAGHYARNLELYGTPLGPGQEPDENSRYSVEAHSPVLLISNFTKNIATHLGTPWPGVNTAITNFYVSFHNKLGIDVNDTRISWGAGAVNRFGIRGLNYVDEIDGNPVQFLLTVLSCGLLLACPGLRKDRLLLKYAGAIAAAALLWVFSLQWHPWMSRLHMPFFILAAPLAGVVLTRFWNARLANVVAPLLLLLGVPWLLFCQQRPVARQENIFNTPRDRLYLSTRRLRRLEPAFLKGKALLESRRPSRIGFLTGNSSIEYWWWPALLQNDPNIRFQHVNVQDPSNRFYAREPFHDFRPDAILALDQPKLGPRIELDQITYLREWGEGRAAVYFPAPTR